MGVNISIRYPELIAASALLELAIHLQSQAQVEHLKPVFSFCILGSCSEKKMCISKNLEASLVLKQSPAQVG